MKQTAGGNRRALWKEARSGDYGSSLADCGSSLAEVHGIGQLLASAMMMMAKIEREDQMWMYPVSIVFGAIFLVSGVDGWAGHNSWLTLAAFGLALQLFGLFGAICTAGAEKDKPR